MPREIVYFLGNLLMYDRAVFEALSRYVRERVGDNDPGGCQIDAIIRALVCSQRPIGRLTGNRLFIADVGVKSLELYELRFDRLEISSIEAGELAMACSHMQGMVISHSELGFMMVRDCEIGFSRIERPLHKPHFTNSRLAVHGNATFVDSRLDHSQFHVEGNLLLHNGTLEDCRMFLKATGGKVGEHASLRTRECQFARCEFSQDSLRHGGIRAEGMNSLVNCRSCRGGGGTYGPPAHPQAVFAS